MENRKRVLIEAAIKHFYKNEMCLTINAVLAYLNQNYTFLNFTVYEVTQVFRENTGGQGC